MESLDNWIDGQYRHSATAMLQSVSSDIVKTRPGFGQVIRAKKGSIVASPVCASYDPEPDYFFHWYRDSAIVVDAMRVLLEDSRSGIDTAGIGAAGIDTMDRFADFVRFSASLQELDGRALNADRAWRGRVADDFKQYLRSEAELSVIRGAATSAETRVNPDASLDISRWPRPQYDGPAMRAVTLLRWLRTRWLDAALQANVEALLYSDLEVIRAHSRESGFDIWEEERGVHYYTLRVSAAALWAGAAWFNDHGRPAEAHAWATEADDILRQLEGYWNPEQRYFRSRVLDSGMPSGKELDISVILAAVHVGADGGTGGHTDTHSAHDPRMRATAARLEALFDAAYPINQARPAERGPAMGRYAGDVYFSGGAYYFSTLGVAEFYFQAALRAPDPRPDIERGDRFLRTVRAYTPPGGDLAEQFDQRTGVPRSARHLAWSYAAFISCIAARRRALDLR